MNTTINHNIVLKKPKQTARHTLDNPEYISEIWYLDENKLSKPIIQTPRLKVKYSAKKWDISSWTYCIGLYNYDIDPEIKAFHNGIKEYDKHIIAYWTNNKREWNLKSNVNIKPKYFTALRRKHKDDDPYLTLKLISNKEGDILTTINDKSRNKLTPQDIV